MANLDGFKYKPLKGLENYLKSREPASEISVLELKRLLVLMAENAHAVCFRYRLIGQMWVSSFMRVIHLTDKGVVLRDDSKGQVVSIPHLKMIIQFELDGSLHTFQPYFHYNVTHHPDEK